MAAQTRYVCNEHIVDMRYIGVQKMMIYEGDKFGAINRLLRTRRVLPAFLAANVLLLLWACCMPSAQAQLSVAVTEAKLENGYEVERVYGGEVRAGRTSTLGFRHAGEVHRIRVQEGDTVAAGALLAELDPEPLRAAREQAVAGLRHAQAQLQVAEAAVELARETTRRHRDLLEKGHTSAQRFDEVRLDLAAREAQVNVAQAERARAEAGLRVADVDLERSRLLAPYPARIQIRHADEGAMLVPGQAVLRIVEEGRREARIGLPVDVAGTLETGARYAFRNGEQRLEGTLLQLLPEVGPRTRTLTALFDLPATESAPPAGSLIELTLTRRITDAGFWLPLAALSEAQRGLWSVFVVVADGNEDRVERRLVEVLHNAENRVFVRGTLADGDAVVATGTQRIVPGQLVVAGAGR